RIFDQLAITQPRPNGRGQVRCGNLPIQRAVRIATMVLIAILLTTVLLSNSVRDFHELVALNMQTNNPAAKQAKQDKLRPWSIDYRESGGIAGRHLAIVVSSDGRAWLPPRTPQPQHKAYRISQERLAELEKLLRSLPLTGQPQSLPPETNFPD